jgi:hypothetical protein
MKLVHGTVLAAGLIAGTLLAQQETVKMGQMMKDQMKEKMGSKDMGGHREMAQLVDQLVASLTAIEAEKDPAALAAKLAEHRKLIEQLQAHVGSMHPSNMATAPAADPHAGHH